MAHVRKQIRDNIASALTGLSTTGANVSVTRVYPFAEAKLPRISIYTRSELSEYTTIGSARTQVRTLSVAVEVMVKTSIDDDLDQIASEIESALASDVTRGGLAKDTRVVGFEAEFSGDGDQPVGSAVISVDVDYVTIEGNPEVSV